ncbi:MAG: SRPBCC family protein [Candidatus Symbiothrix sp.]|jgi:carbon monoxide dehydrogenase subunit G|nr:SRPBCC family protein [Candidatus Symbiothrix sp.]
MTEFISEIKIIPHPQEKVYEVLSDLNNLENVKDKIPADKVQDFAFTSDSVSLSVSPVGQLKISIIEREPPKIIQLTADQAPIGLHLWIQLLPHNERETKMKLTIHADLNPFIKPMVSKPLQEGINKIADVLAAISYNEI